MEKQKRLVQIEQGAEEFIRRRLVHYQHKQDSTLNVESTHDNKTTTTAADMLTWLVALIMNRSPFVSLESIITNLRLGNQEKN